MSKSSSQRAFTVVELLIVIVVIAILAAISVVAYNGVQTRAKMSAQKSLAAQAEKGIMAHALTANGESVALSNTIMGYGEGVGEVELIEPVNGTIDMTLYVVYDVVDTNVAYNGLSVLQPSISGSNIFGLYTANSGSDSLMYRIDTSVQTNLTVWQGGARAVPGKIIGWLQSSGNATSRSFAYNKSVAHNTSTLTTPHAGWRFSSMKTYSTPSGSTVASVLFSGAHDQSTRKQVMEWLADKYQVSGSF